VLLISSLVYDFCKRSNENSKHGVPVKVYTSDIEQGAMQQLRNLAQLEFVHSHIAVMPDVHVGKGATVGSVIPTKSAIIPAAVGVDIGCGMNAVRLSLTASDLPDSLKSLRSIVEQQVPVGFNMHKQIQAKNSTLDPLGKRLKPITDKHPGLLKMLKGLSARGRSSSVHWAVAIILLSFAWMKTKTSG